MNRKQLPALLIGAALCLMAMPILMGWPPADAVEKTRKKGQESTAETGDTDFFPTDITVETDGDLRVSACFATSGVLSIVVKNSAGTVLDTVKLNGATALAADSGYSFDWPCRVGLKYNYQTGTSGDVTAYVDHLGQR